VPRFVRRQARQVQGGDDIPGIEQSDRDGRLRPIEAPEIPHTRAVEEGFFKAVGIERIVAGCDRAHRGPKQRLRRLAHLPGVRQVPIDESRNAVECGTVLGRELDHVDTKLDLPNGLIDLVDHPGDRVDALQRTAQMQLPLSHDRDPHLVHRTGRLAGCGGHRPARCGTLRLVAKIVGPQRLLLSIQKGEFAFHSCQILLERSGWRGDKTRGFQDPARWRNRLRRRGRRGSAGRHQGRLLGLQTPSLLRQRLKLLGSWGRWRARRRLHRAPYRSDHFLCIPDVVERNQASGRDCSGRAIRPGFPGVLGNRGSRRQAAEGKQGEGKQHDPPRGPGMIVSPRTWSRHCWHTEFPTRFPRTGQRQVASLIPNVGGQTKISLLQTGAG